jgi:hypothetical protein
MKGDLTLIDEFREISTGGLIPIRMRSVNGRPITINLRTEDLMRRLGERLEAAARANFAVGKDLAGNPLPPLSEATRAKRRAAGVPDTTTPLHATGTLVAGITAEVVDGGLAVELLFPDDAGRLEAVDHYGEDRLTGLTDLVGRVVQEMIAEHLDAVISGDGDSGFLPGASFTK